MRRRWTKLVKGMGKYYVVDFRTQVDLPSLFLVLCGAILNLLVLLLSRNEFLDWSASVKFCSGAPWCSAAVGPLDVLERFSSNLLFTICSFTIFAELKSNNTVKETNATVVVVYLSWYHTQSPDHTWITQVIRQINHQLILQPNKWDEDHIPQNRLGSMWN